MSPLWRVGAQKVFVSHPPAKVAKKKNTAKRYLQYLRKKNNNY